MPTATQTTSKAPDATDRPEGGYVKALRGRESGIEYPIEPRTICDTDFGPVEVTYDYAAMKGKVTRESIEAGPRSLWRYRDLLPISGCLLYTSPSPRDGLLSRMPSSA